MMMDAQKASTETKIYVGLYSLASLAIAVTQFTEIRQKQVDLIWTVTQSFNDAFIVFSCLLFLSGLTGLGLIYKAHKFAFYFKCVLDAGLIICGLAAVIVQGMAPNPLYLQNAGFKTVYDYIMFHNVLWYIFYVILIQGYSIYQTQRMCYGKQSTIRDRKVMIICTCIFFLVQICEIFSIGGIISQDKSGIMTPEKTGYLIAPGLFMIPVIFMGFLTAFVKLSTFKLLVVMCLESIFILLSVIFSGYLVGANNVVFNALYDPASHLLVDLLVGMALVIATMKIKDE
eukprot:NODE_844_length_3569_cov_0.506052.p2 type:complete len:286 gc:universal NODE_844_length_3569_cov_0.506052:769-1626(+)